MLDLIELKEVSTTEFEKADDRSEDEETTSFFQERANAKQEEQAEQERKTAQEATIIGTGFGGQNTPPPPNMIHRPIWLLLTCSLLRLSHRERCKENPSLSLLL